MNCKNHPEKAKKKSEKAKNKNQNEIKSWKTYKFEAIEIEKLFKSEQLKWVFLRDQQFHLIQTIFSFVFADSSFYSSVYT